jgi:hypothetical protein
MDGDRLKAGSGQELSDNLLGVLVGFSEQVALTGRLHHLFQGCLLS